MPRQHQPLDASIARARQRYGHSLLVVHRDAEKEEWSTRAAEIPLSNGVVRAIPVRMTEAWLLGAPDAIRMASDRPSGTNPLHLPDPGRVDRLPDPKMALEDALFEAAGRPAGRRKQRFLRRLPARKHLVAEYTESFEHLRRVDAFARMEKELIIAIDAGFGQVER